LYISCLIVYVGLIAQKNSFKIKNNYDKKLKSFDDTPNVR